MTERTQIHLGYNPANPKAPRISGYSGRAVRIVTLTPDQVDHNEKVAAEGLGKEATVYEFSNVATRLGLEQMVVEMTEPVSPEALSGEPWRKVTAKELNAEWSTLFTSKDTTMLKRIYAREHVVTEAEVDMIMSGKVLVVD